MADELYVAKDAANFDYNGQPVFVNRGTIVRAGHPIMSGHEDLFEPLTVHFEVPKPEPEAKGPEPEVEEDKPKAPVRKEGAVASSRAEHQGARIR